MLWSGGSYHVYASLGILWSNVDGRVGRVLLGVTWFDNMLIQTDDVSMDARNTRASLVLGARYY